MSKEMENVERRTSNIELRRSGNGGRNSAATPSDRAVFVIGNLTGLAGVNLIVNDYVLPSATGRYGRVQLCATKIGPAAGSRKSTSMFSVRCSTFEVKGVLP